MFCQNCGKEVKENDTFCGFCGAKITKSSETINKESVQEEHKNVQHRSFSETMFGKIVTNYFKHPISTFSTMKNEETMKTSIGFLIGMPILYGLFNMLYFISFFRTIVDNLLHFIGSLSSSIQNMLGISYSESDYFEFADDISKMKSTIQTYISTRMETADFFLKGMLVMFLIILATFIVIEICNITILKNNISHKNIMLIATMGFVPLLLALVLNNILIYISFTFTLIIFAFGFVMSLVTIFGGILQLSNNNKDRAYYVAFINNLVLVIVAPFLMNFALSSVFATITSFFKSLSKFL